MCGEQSRFGNVYTVTKGSPPRVRGTAVCPRGLDGPPGITPACAGNSQTLYCQLEPAADHPRVCGEQRDASRADGHLLGSPPRVRGTGDHRRESTPPPGITPACAGNRGALSRRGPPRKDHPRVCGEQGFPIACGFHVSGSPPRVRGTVHVRVNVKI